MLMDLLGDLAIITVHGQAILILKIDICGAYMNINPCGTMESSLFISSWLIRYLHFLIQ